MPSSSTNREPAISSLRRNLQSEHLARLIELSLEEDAGTPASRTIQSLVRMQLHDIHASIQGANPNAIGTSSSMDAYTRAHLSDASMKIKKALDAQYAIGSDNDGGSLGMIRRFGE
jgi:hypothetical protein